MAQSPPDDLRAALGDGYSLERELGRGGMATVYLAHDLKHKRPVALKVLHPELAATLGPARFEREIEIAARLQHQHILTVYDSGGAGGQLWYTMPFVDGESLRDRLRREGQLGIEEAVRIAREAAAALAYAHQHGVIHRDIKPENLLLTSTGNTLVADFGIARALSDDELRLTNTGLIVGTPAYMSPEQGSGDGKVDGRSDIYSLACVLYEMLAGEPPYTGPTAHSILVKRLTSPVPSVRHLRPTVSAGLDQAVTRALATVAADRFASAAEFARGLDGPPSQTPTVVSQAFPTVRRRTPLIAAAAALVVGLAALAGKYWNRSEPSGVLDANVVAVAPFRVTAADSALRYLREGMVDLLSAKLTGQGGPRAADPRAVMSAWRRVAGSELGDVQREEAIALARRMGAGQLLLGDVVGGAGRITLSATLLAARDGRTTAQTSVTGPSDSLPALVDRLAAELLTLGSSEGEQRLAALTSTSLPALRQYLEGAALYRRGRYPEAVARFGRALDIDSGFALAAVGMLAGGFRTGEYEGVSRGERLAYASRDRLNPRDRAYLMVLMGMSFADTVSYGDLLRLAESFVSTAPDRAEAYSTLAEVLFNYGMALGIPTAHEQAAAAYRRALELDSTYAPALDNLLILSARASDTTSLRRVERLYRAIDPTTPPPVMTRWRAAVALEDTAELRQLRASFDSVDVLDLMGIGQLSQYDGVAVEDAELAHEKWLHRESRTAYRGAVLAERITLEMNRGRPTAALKSYEQLADLGPWIDYPNMDRILDALYWEGDSAAAKRAAEKLSSYSPGPSNEDALRGMVYSCVLEQWHIARGQTGTASRTIERLRAAKGSPDEKQLTMVAHGCAILLDALLAVAEQRADRHARVARLDSLMLTGPPYRMFCQYWNLADARLNEAVGNRKAALAAVRRRLYFMAEPIYLSTYLREEGRLASIAGDSAGAIRAYQHFLALRTDPEPRLRPEVEQVRADLAQLLKEPVQN